MTRSAAVLGELLEERLRPGTDVEDVDCRIQALFGERWCVVFTDMSGFSRTAARRGIIPFLTLMHQVDKICGPVIRRNAGLVLKKIADSHLILFRHPRAALRACVEMQRAMLRRNDLASAPDHIYLGCGIGYGQCLKLGDEDIFGVEVNFAAKLGEDLAGPYSIYVTPDAWKAMGRVAGVRFRKVPGGRLGGTRLPYYEALYAESAADRRRLEQARRVSVRFK